MEGRDHSASKNYDKITGIASLVRKELETPIRYPSADQGFGVPGNIDVLLGGTCSVE